MNYSVKISTIYKFVEISLIILELIACSRDHSYKRQINDNESYLNTTKLIALHAPVGIKLPTPNNNLNIATINHTGELGKKVDIRSPIQPLSIIKDIRSQFKDNTGKLIFIKNKISIWPQILSVFYEKKDSIKDMHNSVNLHTLSTHWIYWKRADEDYQYSGRYHISLRQTEYEQCLTIRLLELRQQGKIVNSQIQIQRYTTLLINEIIESIYQQQNFNKKISNDLSIK